jgi:hypothetical protein
MVIENYYVLTSNELNLVSPVLEKNEQQKKVLLDIILDTSNHFCLGRPDDYYSVEAYENYLEELYSFFTFIDIDGDNDLDLIFDGYQCSGHESESVLIYVNRNSKYEPILINRGKLVHFIKSKELIVYEYPCCAMLENTLKKYVIQKDTLFGEYSLTFYDSPILHDNPELDIILPKKFKKENNVVLIAGAAINYVPKDTINRPTILQNNLLFKTEAELLVTVYARHIDKNGIVWLYCKIPLHLKQNNDESGFFFGWVQHKYCS